MFLFIFCFVAAKVMKHKKKKIKHFLEGFNHFEDNLQLLDCTLKLQLEFKITVMDLPFSVKLALNLKYFERLLYSSLYYMLTKQKLNNLLPLFVV